MGGALAILPPVATPRTIANAGSDGAPIAYGGHGPATSHIFAGSGTPLAPAVSITGYAWTLVSKPTGSLAAIKAGTETTAAPELEAIDAVGTYLLYLVVTDNTGGTSWGGAAGEPFVQGPNSAWVQISVTSQYLTLVIPAAFQRSYHLDMQAALAALDALKGLVASGGAVPVATNAVLGKVQLEQVAVVPATPVVANVHRAYLSGVMAGTQDDEGFSPGLVKVKPVAWNNDDPSRSHASHYLLRAWTLTAFALSVHDTGDMSGNIEVELHALSVAEFAANTYAGGTLQSTLTLTPAGPAARTAVVTGVSGLSKAIASGKVLALLVTVAPPGLGPIDYTLELEQAL